MYGSWTPILSALVPAFLCLFPLLVCRAPCCMLRSLPVLVSHHVTSTLFSSTHPVTNTLSTATGTYFRGTVVEVDPRPQGSGAWDPWETVTIQWDPTANDPGAVERVNPCTYGIWMTLIDRTTPHARTYTIEERWSCSE